MDFMAEHPGQAFSMAELVRALKLSQSTCHSLLSALVQVGYLFRTTERSYVLGPGLASLGRIAAEGFSALQIAQPELRRLADRFDVACSATFREGAWSVVRERAVSARKLGRLGELGVPLLLRAPIAALYFAWRPDEAGEWLAAAAVPDLEQEREALERGMAFVRDNGFVVYLKNSGSGDGQASVEQLFQGDLANLPFALADRIEPGRPYDVSSVAAPVLNGSGHAEFMISMRGFDGARTGAEIRAIADELTAVCARISSFCGGARDASAYSPV